MLQKHTTFSLLVCLSLFLFGLTGCDAAYKNEKPQAADPSPSPKVRQHEQPGDTAVQQAFWRRFDCFIADSSRPLGKRVYLDAHGSNQANDCTVLALAAPMNTPALEEAMDSKNIKPLISRADSIKNRFVTMVLTKHDSCSRLGIFQRKGSCTFLSEYDLLHKKDRGHHRFTGTCCIADVALTSED